MIHPHCLNQGETFDFLCLWFLASLTMFSPLLLSLFLFLDSLRPMWCVCVTRTDDMHMVVRHSWLPEVCQTGCGFIPSFQNMARPFSVRGIQKKKKIEREKVIPGQLIQRFNSSLRSPVSYRCVPVKMFLCVVKAGECGNHLISRPPLALSLQNK